MEIKNSTVIVTGGSSGLGAATAELIVNQGGNVLIADINEKYGHELAKKLGSQALYQNCDVSNPDDADKTIETTLSHFGAIHGLVNCAGIAIGEKTTGKSGAHRLDSFQKVITINLIGTFNMIRVASTSMAQAKPNEKGERGVIVNTASVAAYDGQIGQAAYAASKGGIVGMTLPIARDLARSGIRIMTIAPGIFETPMLAGMPPEVQDSLGKQVPFPSRLGKSAEFAELVSNIFSNSMLNGESIRLDGAIRMTPK